MRQCRVFMPAAVNGRAKRRREPKGWAVLHPYLTTRVMSWLRRSLIDPPPPLYQGHQGTEGRGPRECAICWNVCFEPWQPSRSRKRLPLIPFACKLPLHNEPPFWPHLALSTIDVALHLIFLEQRVQDAAHLSVPTAHNDGSPTIVPHARRYYDDSGYGRTRRRKTCPQTHEPDCRLALLSDNGLGVPDSLYRLHR
jgi:hypothetical protein